MKTSNIALAFTALFALAATTSCNSDRSTQGNDDDAMKSKAVGSWQWSDRLPANMGTGHFTMELQEDGTCEIDMQENTVTTAISNRRSKIIELKGKWRVNGESLETATRIKKWETTYPDGRTSAQEHDEYDVIWKWKIINENQIEFDGINFLLFTSEEHKDDTSLTMSIKGSYITWRLESLDRVD